MSTTDERKFTFLGSRDTETQKNIVTFFMQLGAANRAKLFCKNPEMYYFINQKNDLDCARVLPEGYIFQLDTYLNIMKNQEEKIPEYVECIESKDDSFTVGKIYIWPAPVCNKGVARSISVTCLEGMLWEFKPSTKEAYEAQNTYLKAAEYTPQVGDYVVMEKAGGWGYSPDNNGCVAIVNRIGKTRVEGAEVFSIWGEVINPNKDKVVKFNSIPQFGYGKEVIFRKALPHEIPGSNAKIEPQQQVAEWSIGTYAVALKGNFGVFSFSTNKLPIGKIFTIRNNNNASRDSVGVKESQYWIYKENLKWFATYDEAVQFSNRLPQFEASPTAAVSESPLEICKRKYKKGMLVRSAKEYGEHSGEFIIDVDPSEFYYTGSGVDYFGSKGWLYSNGKFADILEEPKESLTKRGLEIHAEMERKFILDKLKQEPIINSHPVSSESAFPVEAIKKQIKKVKFQEVHEIKTVEEKLLKKTKSKLFNI